MKKTLLNILDKITLLGGFIAIVIAVVIVAMSFSSACHGQTIIPITNLSSNRICNDINNTNCFTNEVVAKFYNTNFQCVASYSFPLWLVSATFTIQNTNKYYLESIETTNEFLINTNYYLTKNANCETVTNITGYFTNTAIIWQAISPAISIDTNYLPTNVTITAASIWDIPYYRIRMN